MSSSSTIETLQQEEETQRNLGSLANAREKEKACEHRMNRFDVAACTLIENKKLHANSRAGNESLLGTKQMAPTKYPEKSRSENHCSTEKFSASMNSARLR